MPGVASHTRAPEQQVKGWCSDSIEGLVCLPLCSGVLLKSVNVVRRQLCPSIISFTRSLCNYTHFVVICICCLGVWFLGGFLSSPFEWIPVFKKCDFGLSAFGNKVQAKWLNSSFHTLFLYALKESLVMQMFSFALQPFWVSCCRGRIGSSTSGPWRRGD